MAMDYPTIMDVPIEMRTRLAGVYNAYCGTCPKCWKDKNNILGFAEDKGELVIVRECRGCFKKFYHHVKHFDMMRTFQRIIALKKEQP